MAKNQNSATVAFMASWLTVAAIGTVLFMIGGSMVSVNETQGVIVSLVGMILLIIGAFFALARGLDESRGK